MPTSLVSLSRPAHLPTVISNCLAGWWLGGGGNTEDVFFLLGGAVLVFLGGAFLNDAFDVMFDRQHRRGRPVPSRMISLRAVWRSGLFLLLAGTLVLQWPGRITAGMALALVSCVVLHDLLHRLIPHGPIVLGICRFLLYALGASVAVQGVTGWSLWCGIAIACYTTAVELIWSSARSSPRRARGGAVLLFVPAGLAGIMNTGPYISSALALGGVFVLWVLWALRTLRRPPVSNRGRPGALLLPGMVLADMLAACVWRVPPWQAGSPVLELSLIFIGLFLASLLATVLEPG